MSAEMELREHIRRVLSESGVDRAETPSIAEEAEAQVLELFDSYVSADEDAREAVYEEKENKLLNYLRRVQREERGSTGAYKQAGRSYSSEGTSDFSQGAGIRDIVYDLISVAYHALQGAETMSLYIADAEQEGDQELAQFFREAKDEYQRRSERAKQLLESHLGQSNQRVGGAAG
jgi:rubrerythrin